NVIQRRLGIVIRNEDGASLACALVEVNLTLHNMVYEHPQSHITICNLLQRACPDSSGIRRLDGTGVVVGLVNVQELRQSAGRDHRVKVFDDLLGGALVEYIEVVSGIMAVKAIFAIGVFPAKDSYDRHLHEVGLSQARRWRSGVTEVDQWI